MFKNKLHINPLLIAAYGFFSILVIFTKDIPFFWDSSFFSQVGNFFYEEGFGNFIVPVDIDAGSFPFYGAYMALAWKFLGKSLLVSHLALLPWMLGIVWEFFAFSKRFLKKNFLALSLLLLLLEPTFVMQCVIMAYDIPLVYFFLFSLNRLLDDKRLSYSLSLCLLTLYSVRGMMLIPVFFLADILIFYYLHAKKNFFRQTAILFYLFPVLSLSVWLVFHCSQTGWYILSPILENRGGQIHALPMILRQAAYSVWQLLDFGRIFLWIFLFSVTGWIWKKNLSERNSILLLSIVLLPFLVNLLFMVPLSNPIGHRYFLPSIILLPVAVCYGLQSLADTRLSKGLALVFSLALITGNFWLYPERLGNGWDSSLKGLQVFSPYEEMVEYTRGREIPSSEVGAEYPFMLDRKFSYLENRNDQYTFLGDKPISGFRYVLRSTVCNTARLDELNRIGNSWILLKEIKSGQVCLRLYENPFMKKRD